MGEHRRPGREGARNQSKAETSRKDDEAHGQGSSSIMTNLKMQLEQMLKMAGMQGNDGADAPRWANGQNRLKTRVYDKILKAPRNRPDPVDDQERAAPTRPSFKASP